MAEVALPDSVKGSTRPCLLGVEKSLSGRRWEARLSDERASFALAQRLSLPEIVGRILAARGVGEDDADVFLNPTLRSLLPDPSLLRGMDDAAGRLAAAIAEGETVAVFGDYDVDGATSSALLARFFKALGRDLVIYIPDRIAEGYGPNETALVGLARQGVRVVITVDCGITAFEPLAAAKSAGLEMIVVDHHAAEPRLPEALAVVNPNRVDESGEAVSKLGHLAAVGVAFLLVVAVNRALRKRGWYEEAGIAEPDLRQWLDLVALGTVCDVVPLKGLNRAFVAQGLKVLGQRANRGLAALCDVSGLNEPPLSSHLGFQLGPRVNAGGRVGEASLGARLLSSEDPGQVAEIAKHLDDLNRERKVLEAAVLDQAILQMEERAGDGPPRSMIFAVSEGWHAGVIGIVASRLKDRYNRPSMVIALENGIGKGSGRSVPGVDLGAAVIAARQAGLLINGGGHPMAAGLTVAADQVPALQAFLEERLGRQLSETGFRPTLGLDGALSLSGVGADLLQRLDACAPFGMGNPAPRFAFPAVRVTRADVVGQNHVRCQVTDSEGARLKAIAFRALDGPLGDALLNSGGLPVHLAGRLEPDRWRGPDAVQLIIEDAAPVTG